jgi:MFS family permease
MRGLLGVIGVLLGGWLADRLGRRDGRWRLWIPGLACALVFPADLLFLLSPDLTWSMVGLAFAHLFAAMHLGPVYAVCVNVAGPQLRATASAVFLFFANLVGQVLGPLVVGGLNDHWQAIYGDVAIRYSMTIGAACALVAGLIFINGARSLDRR